MRRRPSPRHPVAKMFGRLQQGRLADAARLAARLLRAYPTLPAARYVLALADHAAGRTDQAIATLQAVAREARDHGSHVPAEVWYNLGTMLHGRGDHAEAACALLEAARDWPTRPEVWGNLGSAYHHLDLPALALEAYDQALALCQRPDSPTPAAAQHDILYNRAFVHLAQGRLREGFEDYEHRFFSPLWRAEYGRDDLPHGTRLFQGEPLAGRRILAYAEQGLGDTIQFLRYVPLLQEQGAEVAVEVPPALLRLARAWLPGVPVLARGEPLPAHDRHVSLMSLPWIVATHLGDIPPVPPGFGAPLAGEPRWTPPGPGPAAGVVWAGSATHKNDRHRSLPIAAFAPLRGLPPATWVSLQLGERADDAAHWPLETPLLEPLRDVWDVAGTAAVVAELDLVITVDTAVAHLAGTLGTPTIVLLPTPADFRWLRDRADSPWYPGTVELLRQPRPGDWASVLTRLRTLLETS
jgi:hypothetical protein